MSKTVNVTMVIEDRKVNPLEERLRQEFRVLDYRILPDTRDLYENDPYFQKLLKIKKDHKTVIDRYINNHNNK